MENFQKKLVLALLGYLAQRSVSPQKVCELAGISYATLTGKKSIALGPAQVEALWKNAAALSNDPYIGLHFGESMQLAALGLVGQIIQSSNTVGDAITQAGAVAPLVTDVYQMRVSHQPKTFTLHFIADKVKAAQSPFTARQMGDYLIVFSVHELEGLLLEKIEPTAASLPYSVTDLYEYNRLLRCKIRTRTDELSIEFPKKYWDLPVLSANYQLQNFLLQQVQQMLPAKDDALTLHKKIYSYLLTNSYLYSLSLEAVAANFNTSPRNLQRKLKEEGVTFLQIVDDVRKTLALHYLQSGNYSIKDIAYTLGYNEQSAFLRAFKRWTGHTPATYKNTAAKKIR